ncbi:MAG: sodium/solute symporter [Filomicrobium sp.]
MQELSLRTIETCVNWMGLHGPEIGIVAAYLVATFGLALYLGRQGTESDSVAGYFLAGRALPWYLIGFSFYASNMSGSSFVGLVGAAYSHGLSIFHYEWTAALVLVAFAIFVLPVFLRRQLYTVPEYLEHRFERRARTTYSVFTLLTLLFIDTAGALYAGAVVISTGLPFLDLWTACIVISICTGLYTIFGGLRTVVITDTLQSFVLIAGAAVVAGYGLAQVGGWDALLSRLDERHVELFRDADDDALPWPGIFGIVILGLYYWTFNQYFVQRALAARTLDEGRKGALLAGFLKLLNLFLMIVPGLVAAALYPTLDSPDKAFPTLTFDLLPAGFRGIVLAAMLAAIMSSLDSALNAASSLATMDLARIARPTLSERALSVLGRLVTAVFMVIAAIYAPMIGSFGSLFDYFQATLAYLVPPFVGVYLAGLFSSRFTRASAFWTIVIVEPLGLLFFFANEVSGTGSSIGLPDIHFTYAAVGLLALTLCMMTLFSLLWQPDGPPVDPETVFSVRDFASGGADHSKWMIADYRLLAFLLLTATAALLVWLSAY